MSTVILYREVPANTNISLKLFFKYSLSYYVLFGSRQFIFEPYWTVALDIKNFDKISIKGQLWQLALHKN